MALRHQRVGELLKRELGEVLRQNYAMDRYGLISIAHLEMGNDLKSARVYLGIVGNKMQRQSAFRRLQKDRIAIQNQIGSRVILKYLPQLRFILDVSQERGDRVLEIIEELEGTKPDADLE